MSKKEKRNNRHFVNIFWWIMAILMIVTVIFLLTIIISSNMTIEILFLFFVVGVTIYAMSLIVPVLYITISERSD